MLLTVSTTHVPARDLGHLLHKHPDRVQQFTQSFGSATVFYPEATAERCTAALLLEVDPIRLARRRARTPDFSLAQYVNDRPYAASSLLGVALADVFSTARSGRCDARQELADSAIPLEISLPVLPCRGGADRARRVFEPLGWQVEADPARRALPGMGGTPATSHFDSPVPSARCSAYWRWSPSRWIRGCRAVVTESWRRPRWTRGGESRDCRWAMLE